MYFAHYNLLFKVVEEEDPEVVSRIGSWISSAYADRLNVEVVDVFKFFHSES